MKIGGNIIAVMQVKDEGLPNRIGEREHEWFDVCSIRGWLDLSTGDSRRESFSAKIQESTHIFICDFQNHVDISEKWQWNPHILIDSFVDQETSEENVEISSEYARMVIKGRIYDILLIDNPMEMDQQLEFYLKFVGGQ